MNVARIAVVFAAGLALACAASGAAAQASPPAAAPVPLEEYLRLPQYASPALSPDGRHVAVATPVNGRLNLAVVDMQTRKGTGLTSYGDFDVVDIRWVGNDRLVFSLGQFDAPTGPGEADGGGLFMVSRDGRESRVLAPTVRESPRQLRFLSTIPGSVDEIMVVGNRRSADARDVYRIELLTGRATLVSADRPERTQGWILDDKLVPRVARAAERGSLGSILYYRASAGAPWKEVKRDDASARGLITPLAMMDDGRTLLVASNAGRDTMAVRRFDPETGTLGDIVAEHPAYDIGANARGESVPGLVREPETGRLLGYVVDGERPQTFWFDEREARTQATVDAALPNARNEFARVEGSSRVLVSSYSDMKPVTYYILDEQQRTLEELFSSKPWLSESKLVEMRPFLLKTRDGLQIPSYYFLPKSWRAGDRLPTVVHVHGGPPVRADHWGRGFGYQEAELLASRGYAVVLPNFRVTPGFGARIYRAGFGTLGRQMSQDHEDAARWAVDQGFADPARICISGASYGGYAALVAVAKAPELFRCAVAGLVVSDVDLQVRSLAGDTGWSDTGYTFWAQLAGLDEAKKPAFREASPLYMADRIKAPVFMYAGADDIRTPLEQTRAMASALERAGNPPRTVLIKEREGHGFGRLENRVDLYEKMLKFLGEQIGPNAR